MYIAGCCLNFRFTHVFSDYILRSSCNRAGRLLRHRSGPGCGAASTWVLPSMRARAYSPSASWRPLLRISSIMGKLTNFGTNIKMQRISESCEYFHEYQNVANLCNFFAKFKTLQSKRTPQTSNHHKFQSAANVPFYSYFILLFTSAFLLVYPGFLIFEGLVFTDFFYGAMLDSLTMI